MRRIVFLLLTISLSFSLFAQDADSTNIANEVIKKMQITSPEDLIARATLAYEQGNYQQTIDDYESLSAVYAKNADIYYNLGNAYYKNNNFAKAILNYERCLIYDPANDDAKANLELARLCCVDKIESIEPIIFKKWSEAIGDTFTCGTWTNLSIVLFLLFSICAGGYFFMSKIAIRKTGFYLGILSILLCFVCIYFADKQNKKINERDYAIVMSPTVTVRSEPADSGTKLFTIHEGLKVKIRWSLNGWSEVELSDGNVGWLPSATFEKI